MPKFKIWHPEELAYAVEAGTIFVSKGTSGKDFLFQIKSDRVVQGMIEIQRLRDARTTTDVTDLGHRFSIDQPVFCLGNWPGYLSIKSTRVKYAHRSDKVNSVGRFM